MNYGEALARTWKIFWKIKVLWVYNLIPYLVYYLFFVIIVFFTPIFPTFLSGLLMKDVNASWLVFLEIGVFSLFVLLFGSATILGTTATLSAVSRAEGRKKKLAFFDLLKDSRRYFWKVLGLHAIFMAGLVVLLALFLGGLILTGLGTSSAVLLCLIPLFFLIVVLALIGSAVLELTRAAAVLDSSQIPASLRSGWRILKKSFWRILLMALILYGGRLLLSTIAFLPLGLLFWAVSTSSWTATDNQSFESTFSILIIAYLAVGPYMLAFQGLVLAYIRSAWALTYLRLTRPAAATRPAIVENA